MSKPQHTEVLPPENPLTPASTAATGMDIATTRQSAEIQSAMVIAKKFPRNETVAISRIMQACERLSLAESALYAYPRGGTTVSGPSIRLAEALAKNWSNIDFGVIELEQKQGESVVMAYCWDLETNTRSTKIFTVKHERKAKDKVNVLTDPRDIYEMTANQGARRLRACILSIVPGDVTEMAVDACERTMKSGDKTPMKEKIAKVTAFFAGFNVTVPMIEKRLGHKIETINETELVTLRKIAKTLDDNAGKADDFFDFSAVGKSSPSKPEHTVESPAKQAFDEHASAPDDSNPDLQPADKSADKPADDKAPTEGEQTIIRIADLAKGDGVNEWQIVQFARKNKMCPSKATSLSEFTDANLRKLETNWGHFVENVKAYPAK